MPVNASARASRSNGESGLSAATTPSATPVNPPRIIPAMVSSRVAGNRSAMTLETGLFPKNERPKSPCSTPPM